MTRLLKLGAVAALVWFASAGAAQACSVVGKLVCLGDGTPLAGVTVTMSLGGYQPTAVTDASGAFAMTLVEGGQNYDVTALIDGNVVPLGTVFVPNVEFHDLGTFQADAGCGEEPSGMCWLTGGGAKFSGITGGYVAEHGPRVNFGGNVYPSCGTEPGNGGQWNHLDRSTKQHFQMFAIVVDRCGNVSGIPPGSTSPVTPFNFIEWHGTGVVKPLAGASFPTTEVCFEARAEDRNEPGSSGAKDGAKIDRYYMRAFDCVTDATLYVFEDADQAGASDPLAITDGNLQLHDSSCAQ